MYPCTRVISVVVPLLRAILFANTFVRVDLPTIAFQRFDHVDVMSSRLVMLSRVAMLWSPLCRVILSPVTFMRINLSLVMLSRVNYALLAFTSCHPVSGYVHAC